jgi:hypothetical protein
MGNDHDTKMAWLKMFYAWLFVGASQMTPLQALQAAAAIAATIYSVVQTYLLVRDRIIKRRAGQEPQKGEQ